MNKRETTIYICSTCGFESEQECEVVQCEQNHRSREEKVKDYLSKTEIVGTDSDLPVGTHASFLPLQYSMFYPRSIKVKNSNNGFEPATYILFDEVIPSVIVNKEENNL